MDITYAKVDKKKGRAKEKDLFLNKIRGGVGNRGERTVH
jgi:hypothetical protein